MLYSPNALIGFQLFARFYGVRVSQPVNVCNDNVDDARLYTKYTTNIQKTTTTTARAAITTTNIVDY